MNSLGRQAKDTAAAHERTKAELAESERKLGVARGEVNKQRSAIPEQYNQAVHAMRIKDNQIKALEAAAEREAEDKKKVMRQADQQSKADLWKGTQRLEAKLAELQTKANQIIKEQVEKTRSSGRQR